MKVKKLLYKILGLHTYLRLISYVYITLVKLGFFKKKYPELFYLKTLIKEGNVVIDIGANVGYYTVFLSLYCGESGKVYSVEPVPDFVKVLKKNIASFGMNNVHILPYALGSEEGSVVMGTPVVDGIFRHGLTKVITNDTSDKGKTYNVEMKVPRQLFAHLEKLDFIKCDVEGYEVNIIPEMKDIFKRFQPVLQIEITGSERREFIYDFMHSIDYRAFRLKDEKLLPLSREEMLNYNSGDFYFIHK